MDAQKKLWLTYVKTKSPEIKEKLITSHAKIVKFVAGRLHMHVGAHVDYDDLVGYGVFGLIDAIEKFDPTKDVKFETYASLRIRGSIIDEIRKLDWVPRTLRQKNKLLEAAYNELEDLLEREPTEAELAQKLELDIDATRDLIKKSSVLSLVSLDEFLEQNYETTPSDGLTSDRHDSPEEQTERHEREQMLADAIEKLSDREKQVITLYYYENLTLKEISSIIGVTESRISQIHTKALGKLQGKLGKYKNLLFN
jgi:RNA polymerase sigma factor for flagellar operon FliA